MKVSFTGAQSTGKTTLLNKCKEVYKDYSFVDEVTRHVKKSYGVVINEDGGDATQLYILSEHIKNHLRSDENLILDRCILDGFIYTKYLFWNQKVGSDVMSAYTSIFPCLYNMLDIVFYTDPSDVKLVDDGERSIDINFRNDIIDTFDKFIKSKILPLSETNKIVTLSGTVEQRMETIKKYLK